MLGPCRALRVPVRRCLTNAKPRLPLPAAHRKPAPTPGQIAKVVMAKLKSPVGQPDKAELALRVVLRRARAADGAGAS